MVGHKIVPAGECAVRVATLDDTALTIRNWGAHVSLYSLASRTEGKQNAPHYTLAFHQYGDRYFLSGIKVAGDNIVYRFPENKVEAELRAQKVSAKEKTVLASLE